MDERNDYASLVKPTKKRQSKIDYFERLSKRMPKGVRLINDSWCNLNEDEYVVACSWIGLFKRHWEAKGAEPIGYIFIPISKRLNIDFGLFYMKDHLHDPIVTINRTNRATVKHNERTWLLRWIS